MGCYKRFEATKRKPKSNVKINALFYRHEETESNLKMKDSNDGVMKSKGEKGL